MVLYNVYGKGSTATKRDAVANSDPNQLPVISQGLDAVRTYQWEFQLDLPAVAVNPSTSVAGALAAVVSAAAQGGGAQQTVTLAAKQVGGFGYKFADIEVHRVNDKVFYPGKLEQDELTVTFDNLLSTSMGKLFYEYLASVYDMRTGHYNSDGGAVGSYKTSARILEFDGGGNIQTVYDFKGLYPKGFTKAEKNYSTSEFDTMEVKFRWDFMNIQTGSQASDSKGLLI
jgi:hypothetical protein